MKTEHVEFCFILRKLSLERRSYSVLTQHFGRVDIIIKSSRQAEQLVAGTFLTGLFCKKSSRAYHVRDVRPILHPLCTTAPSLYALHHLLELAYYFLAPNDPEPRIFSLLYLFTKLTSLNDELDLETSNKLFKLFVLKFFCLIGLQPHKDISHELKIIDAIMQTYVDLPFAQQVECLKNVCETLLAKHVSFIDSWVLKCVRQHPSLHKFQTIHFTQKLGLQT